MKKTLLRVLCSGLLVAGLAVPSAAQSKFKLRTWVEDPGNTGAGASEWRAGEGLADGGKNDAHYALYMQKFAATSVWVGGGATIDGVKNARISELGWDVRNDGHCGPAPRFNVYTDAGLYYFAFGCVYGVHTPAPDDPINWTRVRFRDQDAYPAYANQSPWPGFGNVKVYDIWIVFDEGTDQGPGYTYLDNVDINTDLIGKPSVGK